MQNCQSSSPSKACGCCQYRSSPARASADAALAKALKKWQPTGVFDAISLLNFPPTFADAAGFQPASNALMKEVGGRFIISTLPVGKEGWETSANQRLAQKLAAAGAHYDASKAMTQRRVAGNAEGPGRRHVGWVLEHRRTCPRRRRRHGRQASSPGSPKHSTSRRSSGSTAQAPHTRAWKELMRGICEATRADADFFVWMDLPRGVAAGGRVAVARNDGSAARQDPDADAEGENGDPVDE